MKYGVRFEKLVIIQDTAGRSLRIDGLRVDLISYSSRGNTSDNLQTGFSTDIDIREGQKAVIGKASIDGGAKTVFVVIDGTVVE